MTASRLIPQMWEKRVRLKRTPYGFIKDPQDDRYVLPDPDVIEFLEEALINLNNGVSLRDTANWLQSKTGQTLSHVGLRNIWFEYFPEKKLEVNPRNKRKLKTPEERAIAKKRAAIRAEKVKLTHTKKKLESLTGGIVKIEKDIESKVPDKGVKEYTEMEYSSLSEEKKSLVIFEPNPGPQTDFLAADELEVLYGGAAGGGKSYALIADPMRFFDNPNFNGLIVRRTINELRELITKAQMLYKRAYGDKIRWMEQKSTFKLPGGGFLWFSYLDREEDVQQYIGQAFTYIAFDELTQHPTSYAWNFMRSRLRDASGTLPLYMRATTNPGGPGHGWVKRMFIDPAPYDQAFWATDIETGKVITYPKHHATKADQPVFKRRFIPAKLIDNPYLYEDGQYEANLLSLPEAQQRQLLEGDWSLAEGAAFSEFRIPLHTCRPFEVPEQWRKFRSGDYGYSTRQASAIHWYAIDPQYGTLYVYRELYVNQLTGRELAKKILQIERDDKISYGVLDSSVWSQRGQTGPSIAEEMISEGCRWRPSDRTKGSRIAGKNRLHELLRIDPISKRPGIIFFDTCRQIISDLPVIPADKDSDDIDPDYATDHAYDSIRYGIMSRPKATGLLDWHASKTTMSYAPSNSEFGY